MIKIDNGIFKYNDNVIFSNFNLTIKEHEITAIIGNNGIGKTTLLNVISGLYLLKKGNLTIDDLVVNKHTKSLDIRNKISIVGQNPDNYIIFNKVYDDMAFTLKNMHIKGDYKDIITSSLKVVGMDKYIDSNPYELSYGQKQRVVIASQLSINTPYVVLDEVTAMLDSNNKQVIYKLMDDLKKSGKTVIYTTNLMEELIYADNIIVLNDNEPIIINKMDLIKNIDLLERLGFYIPLSLNILKIMNNKKININYDDKSIIESIDKLL